MKKSTKLLLYLNALSMLLFFIVVILKGWKGIDNIYLAFVFGGSLASIFIFFVERHADKWLKNVIDQS